MNQNMKWALGLSESEYEMGIESESEYVLATWELCGSGAPIKGRGLEGVDDITLCDAAQVFLVEKGPLEPCGVDLSQDHLAGWRDEGRREKK